MADFIIKNVQIFDGSGEKPFIGDVAITGKIFSDIGDLSQTKAQTVIEADGKVITPGFIDMHSHSDVLFLNGDPILHKLYQGVTTEVIGQDGISAAPMTENSKQLMADIIEPMAGKADDGWNPLDMEDFFHTLAQKKVKLNVASLTGHCNLRMAVMGHKMAFASQEELQKMCAFLEKSLKQGSLGLSLGLIYPPASYSNTEELIALGHVVKKYGGILVAHIRNEQDQIIDAMKEMLEIGAKCGCKIHISHLKCLGKNNWSKMPKILELMDNAIEQGIEITFDQYPYDASNTTLSLLLPAWAVEGGFKDFEKRSNNANERKKILAAITETIESRGGGNGIKIASVMSHKNRKVTGKSIDDLAESRKMPVAEAVLDLLTEEKLQVMAIYHAISDNDIECAMAHHLHTVGSDGVLGTHTHPRAFGTFPRVINHYSREKGLFPLEVAIERMTSKPAKILQFTDRGLIKKGYYADLVIFEKAQFVDNSSFNNPDQFATGLDWVFVNGIPAISEGQVQENYSGSILKSGLR